MTGETSNKISQDTVKTSQPEHSLIKLSPQCAVRRMRYPYQFHILWTQVAFSRTFFFLKRQFTKISYYITSFLFSNITCIVLFLKICNIHDHSNINSLSIGIVQKGNNERRDHAGSKDSEYCNEYTFVEEAKSKGCQDSSASLKI